MPVFYYLGDDEVADAYLYLRLYPPAWTVPDPEGPVTEQKQAGSKIVQVGFTIEPTAVGPPSNARDLAVIIFPVAAALLLAGGFWFTLREIRRLTAVSDSRKAVVMSDGSVAQHAILSASNKSRPRMHPVTHNNDNAGEVVDHGDKPSFHHDDYHTFESSWLTRWLERKDEAA
jgi:hypothetical protein